MNKAYGALASTYDQWTDNIDYGAWWNYLTTTFELHGRLSVLELGCGTGHLTQHVAAAGHSVLATDLSVAMLTQAEHKLSKFPRVRLLNLDMRELPSNLGTFDVVLAACDVMNYSRDEAELDRVLAGVKPLLKPTAVFLFDTHGPGRLAEFRTERYFNAVDDDHCYLWERTVSGNTITHNLTGFVRARNSVWHRFDEQHRQQYFDHTTILTALSRRGFEKAQAYDFSTTVPPHEASLRIQFAANWR